MTDREPAQAWEELCEALRRAGALVTGEGVPDSPRDRAEGFRYLTRLLAAGIVTCVAHADGDDPRFARMVDFDMRWGLDCPDCLYLYAGINGESAYRIWGKRGSAHHIDIQVTAGHFATGRIADWTTIASTNSQDLQVQADGSFELLLGSERHDGNWLPLAPGAEFVLVRQYFNDWDNEQPADIYIERVGANGPAQPPTTEQIAARLDKLAMWMERSSGLWEQMSKTALAMPPNSLTVHLPADAGERAGLRGQAYGLGNFRCAPDEAIIVELTPPACHYWSISLANWYWESLDFATRQTSLNGHQAVVDSDGVVRIVIAHADPGVANWLDTAGHIAGTLAARFLLADAAPAPQSRVVKLAELDAALPPDTRRVTAAERATIIERRRLAVLRRYRW
jgi:hypothetical protein